MSQRVRYSIQDIQRWYDDGSRPQLLNDLVTAWRGIQNLPAAESPFDSPPEQGKAYNSFFTIAGYHGLPFRGAGFSNSQWWGGYCNHGNVLFPTWHRAYLWRLENALRSIPGCQDVTLPFWDETGPDTTQVVPTIFLMKNFPSNSTDPNPLYSYVLAKSVFDNLAPFPDADYTKPGGYATVRYPLSGLVGPNDLEATLAHNAQFSGVDTGPILNGNVRDWLYYGIVIDGTTKFTGTYQKYVKCLDAPDYTVFSNTTSAAQWNEDHFNVTQFGPPDPKDPLKSSMTAVVPLESPHNDIHLSIGGFQIPGVDYSPIPGANGDMGENDTASFDPIFFFHHCHVDRFFWLWQKRHGQTTRGSISIRAGYPGTNSVDNQGPTPGVAGNSWLTMDTPLAPFTNLNGSPTTSNDMVDITSIDGNGYTYGPGSFDQLLEEAPRVSPGEKAQAPIQPPRLSPEAPHPYALRITGVSRAAISGSFMLATYADIPGIGTKLLDVKSVLSRRHTEGCANCQTHMNVKTIIPLHMLTAEQASDPNIKYAVTTMGRGGEEIASGGISAGDEGKVGKPPAGKAGLQPNVQFGRLTLSA